MKLMVGGEWISFPKRLDCHENGQLREIHRYNSAGSSKCSSDRQQPWRRAVAKWPANRQRISTTHVIDNKYFIDTKLVTEFAAPVDHAATKGNLRLGLKCASRQPDAKSVFVPPRVDA
jgi:hypothetical protein